MMIQRKREEDANRAFTPAGPSEAGPSTATSNFDRRLDDVMNSMTKRTKYDDDMLNSLNNELPDDLLLDDACMMQPGGATQRPPM